MRLNFLSVDIESGYHYNWHRYYDPSTGRYLTPDPIGLAGGLNGYGYAGQDPLRQIDPWEVYAERFRSQGSYVKVTEASVTYVAIDDNGKPMPVPKG